MLKRVERGGSAVDPVLVRNCSRYSILMKMQLPGTADVHRRVLAVLAFLDAH